MFKLQYGGLPEMIRVGGLLVNQAAKRTVPMTVRTLRNNAGKESRERNLKRRIWENLYAQSLKCELYMLIGSGTFQPVEPPKDHQTILNMLLQPQTFGQGLFDYTCHGNNWVVSEKVVSRPCLNRSWNPPVRSVIAEGEGRA